jgi:transcriptional regulator with XRE-family HTH domain
MNLAPDTSQPETAQSANGDLCRYPNLRTHREQRGMSQAKLAALAGVGKDLVSSAERHNAHRRMKLLAVIHALNEHERTKSYGRIDPERELLNA